MLQRNDTGVTMRVNLPDGSSVEVGPGGEIDCPERVGGFVGWTDPEPEPAVEPAAAAEAQPAEPVTAPKSRRGRPADDTTQPTDAE